MIARRLRIVLFGSGGLLSAASLYAAAAEHEVLAVVRAARGGRTRRIAGGLARRLGMLAPDPLARAASVLRVPQWPVASMRASRLLTRLAAARPDLIAVAHFPWRLPEAVLASAALGGVNLHPSLLPRHRGPLPLFWIYQSDDRETGVTVHRMTAELDRGDIIDQRTFPLARGFPVDELNAVNARTGAELLQEVLRSLARGDAPRRAQDETRATRAPFLVPGHRTIDFTTWDVERVWHFLAGVWPRFTEPLIDAAGRPVSYAGVVDHARGAPPAPPGLVQPLDSVHLSLACRDGVVRLLAGRAGQRRGA